MNLLKPLLLFLFIVLFFSCKEEKSFGYSTTIFQDNYLKLSENKKVKYLDSIEIKIIKESPDSLKTKLLFEIAEEYYNLGHNDQSLKTSRKIYELSKYSKDSVSLGRSLYYIGDCYENFEKDSAYYYYRESEKIFRLIKNDEKLAKSLFNKAHLLFSEGNHVESEIEVIKALQKLKKSKKYLLIYSCYYLQACNHTELGELEKALEYLDLSSKYLNLNEHSSNKKRRNSYYDILITIGKCNIYDKKGAYYKSIKELEMLCKNKDEIKDIKLYSSILGNLGYAYMKNGQLNIAKKKILESFEISKKIDDSKGILFKLSCLGEYYLIQSDTLKATQYFTEALSLAKKLKTSRELLNILNLLSLSDKKNTVFYKDEYVRVSDSLIKKQRESKEKFARIEYETDKIAEENKILSNKNLMLLLFSSLLAVVFLVIIIIKNKISRNKEALLTHQKELADEELYLLTKEFQLGLVKAKEQEQKRLSKELHDGIVNKIYALRMMLEILNSEKDEVSQMKRKSYVKELHKIETEVRNLSHNLNTDFSSYNAEFDTLIEQIILNNKIISKTEFILEIPTYIDWNSYSSVVKINVYRILQELLQNVNKHADAKNCYITIFENENHLIVEVKDNGIGFDLASIPEGIGLKNIKERVESIQAQIEIKSSINKGTIIKLKIENFKL